MSEITVILDGLTPQQHRDMLCYFAGWDRTGFDRALESALPLPATTGWTAACQSCGATTGLDPVHRRAEYGLAARTEYYCHQPGPCAERRHGHAVAISGIAS